MGTSARHLSSGHIIYDLKRTVPVKLPKNVREQKLVTCSLAELMKLAEIESTRVAATTVMQVRIDRMNKFRKDLGQEILETPEAAAKWERQLFKEAAQDPRVTAHKIKLAMKNMPVHLREIPLRTLVASRDLAAIEVRAMGRTVKNGYDPDFMEARVLIDQGLQAIGKSFATKDARQSLRGVEQTVTKMMKRPPRFLGFGAEQTRTLRDALKAVEDRLSHLSDDPMGLDVDLDARQRSVESKAYQRASKEAAAQISEQVDQMVQTVGDSSRLAISEFMQVQKTLKALQIKLAAMEQTQGIDIDIAHQNVLDGATADALVERLHSFSDATKMRFDAARYFLSEHPSEVRTKSEPRSARSTPDIERDDNELAQICAADLLISMKDADFQRGVWDLRGRINAADGADYVPLLNS